MPRVIRSLDGKRVCSKCETPKETTEFYKTPRTSDGCQAVCIVCHLEYSKVKNAAKPKKPKKPLKTKEEKAETQRLAKIKKKETTTEEEILATKAYQKQYRLDHKEELKEYKRVYQILHKERLNEISRLYHQSHPEERKEYLIDYLPRRRRLRKERHQNDELFRASTNLRCGITRAFKGQGWSKTGRSEEILGADYETVKKWIERQFKKGMTWKNNTKTGWHIDHIIPLSFAKTEEELKMLCHYTNLQPLWYDENIRKQNKIVEHQVKLPL